MSIKSLFYALGFIYVHLLLELARIYIEVYL